jgi:hypothetical protein
MPLINFANERHPAPTRLQFPSDLDKSDSSSYMRFKIQDAIEVSEVILPVPAGLNFSDGASYGTMNLGAIGSQFKNGGSLTAGGFLSGSMDSVRSSIDRFIDTGGGNIGGAVAAGILAKAVPGASFTSATEVFQFANKQVLNAYTNVNFTGTAPRAYAFAFKLMASSAEESKIIKAIEDTFKLNMYPEETDDFILKYPSKFKISFWVDDKENEYIAAIAECYLTSLNVTYNATSSVFFEDTGAPAEIDISLSFQETRSQTQNDLIKLEKEKIK